MKALEDETERETLADLIEHPGWKVLWNTVIPPVLQRYTQDAFKLVRDTRNASHPVGVYDGIVKVLESTYLAADIELPDSIKTLKRGQ